tara:strand:- start:434 stop:664 length:231 start_codon:yes stop_codon:yes gene_type:complete
METFMKNIAITLVVSVYTCSIFFMGTIVQEGDKAYSYMEYVFIATLIGFPVFGVISIIYAIVEKQVRKEYRKRHYI